MQSPHIIHFIKIESFISDHVKTRYTQCSEDNLFNVKTFIEVFNTKLWPCTPEPGFWVGICSSWLIGLF